MTVATALACRTCHQAAGTVLLHDQAHCATCARSWLLLHVYVAAADQALAQRHPRHALLLLALAEQEADRLDRRAA